jgi:hypothetical protein
MAVQTYRAQADKLKEIKQTLQGVLDQYHENPEEIAEMLAFKSRFWNYSLNNSILIQSQNPGATYVASYRDWLKKGYHVTRGQHGIKVLFPIRTELIPLGIIDGKQRYRRAADAAPEEKEQIRHGKLKTVTYTRFGVGTVFDISQTDCPPQDYPKFYDMGYSSAQHAALYQAIRNFTEQKGIPVEEADLKSISLRGAFYPKENVIRISDKLNDTERLSTLTHELGHALMHNSMDALKLPRPALELEADAVSIMLQQYCDISLTDSRKDHFVQNYNACRNLEGFKLEDALKQINATYQDLRRELEPTFDQLKDAEKTSPADKERKPKSLEQDYSASTKNTVVVNKPQTSKKSIQSPPKESLMEKLESYHLPATINKWQQAALRGAVKRYFLIGEQAGKQHLDEFFSFWSEKGFPVSQENQAIMKKTYNQIVKDLSTHPVQGKEPSVTSPASSELQQDRHKAMEYIKYGISILTVARDMGFTPVKIGSYYTLKEHDSVRIYPETNSFNRFSTGVGGSNIDFVMHFGGLNEKQAIKSLKDKYVGDRFAPLPQPAKKVDTPAPKPKPFVLPEKTSGRFTRAFAYLTKTRCLDREIVQQCMKDGLIYEDKMHNAVFVGKDSEGQPVYATRHTTLTNSSFKRDVAGSRQDVGFMVDNHSSRLYVTEAPIDALSIMCLHKRQGKDIYAASYMATCGTGKDATLYYRLKANPNINEVILANDNDDAGRKANQKICAHLRQEFPQIKIGYIRQGAKDINEYLCEKAGKQKCAGNPEKQIVQEVDR